MHSQEWPTKPVRVRSGGGVAAPRFLTLVVLLTTVARHLRGRGADRPAPGAMPLRRPRPGRAPLGHVFELVRGNAPEDRIPPQAARQLDGYLGTGR